LLITGLFIGKRFVENRKKEKGALRAKAEKEKDEKLAIETFKKSIRIKYDYWENVSIKVRGIELISVDELKSVPGAEEFFSATLDIPKPRVIKIQADLISPEVEAFLKDSAINEAQSLLEKIKSSLDVKKVDYISKEEATARLKKDLRDSPEMLGQIEGNPLPASFIIIAKNPDGASRIAKELNENEFFEEVHHARIKDLIGYLILSKGKVKGKPYYVFPHR
jgi:hypothetical protein